MNNIGEYIDNRYRLERKIGSGGMADVFEATDLILKKSVALKIVKDSLLNEKKKIEEAKQEAKVCAYMSHPNIIKILNQGEYENKPYLVYEYIDGNTLNKKLEDLTFFPLKESIMIIKQVCLGLKCIHEHGIIHRDIKPQNIFYLSDGSIKIGDFGISIDKTLNDYSNEILGSIYYLAPEVIQGEPSSIKSDIYALGIMFFELLTGRLPFEDGNSKEIALKHINDSVPNVCMFNSDLPNSVNLIIKKSTAKDLNMRYNSVEEFYSDVLKIGCEKKNKNSFFNRLFGFK